MSLVNSTLTSFYVSFGPKNADPPLTSRLQYQTLLTQPTRNHPLPIAGRPHRISLWSASRFSPSRRQWRAPDINFETPVKSLMLLLRRLLLATPK